MYPTVITKKDLPRIILSTIGKRYYTRFYLTTNNPNLTYTKSSNLRNSTYINYSIILAVEAKRYILSDNTRGPIYNNGTIPVELIVSIP